MSLVIDAAVTLVSGQLGAFANQDNFWSLFDVAFGKNYNQAVALRLRSQWRSGDFGSFPLVEVIGSAVLGSANGAYGSSTNRIYLSDAYVKNATTEALIGTLLEEYGHFVDAQVNRVDSAGDEGAIFAALVRGELLDAETLQILKSENDWASITINGQVVGVEQSASPVIVNKSFTVSEGNSIIVTNSFLRTTDVDNTDAQLIYTLKSLPVNGALRLNGVNLGVNGTFSQDDINNSRVTYIHNGSQTANDTFNFVVSDGDNTTTRISTATDGTQGNSDSLVAAISADGRYVAFSSTASNLVSGDTNGIKDAFVKDLTTNIITRVSTAANGTQSNGNTSNPSISGNGRYVVFESDASNLVSGDTNGTSDVFVKDLTTNIITRVSTAANGTQGNNASYQPVISSDGRYVVFKSAASNLVSGDTNGDLDSNGVDVFVKDLITSSITRVSTASNGAQGNNGSGNGSISADGRYVVFESDAFNLVNGDTNGGSGLLSINGTDIFIKDLTTNATTRVSTAADGTQGIGGFSYNPAISADGRYVVFESDATNLVSGDTNGTRDIFVKNLTNNNVIRVSTASNGTQGNNGSSSPAISADGRYVVFESTSSNLVSGDTNGTRDVFVKDLTTNNITRLSNGSDSSLGSVKTYHPSISADGSYITFASYSSNLVSGDTNGSYDVFLSSRRVINGNVGITVNLVPVVTTTSAALSYIENAISAIDSAIIVSDVDSVNLASATVSITSGFILGQDFLNFTNQNGITGTYNSSTGILSLTGSSTVANYQTALRSITYTNNSDSPNTNTRTIGFRVSDGTASSIQRTRNITITAVNDAPIVSNAISNQSATTGTAFNFIIPANSFSDPDAGDILTYSATRADGTALPTWLIFNPATRTFSGSPTSGNVGNLSVKVTAKDTANASVSSNFAIAILPSITLAVAPASVTEDGVTNLIYTFTRTGVPTNALTVNYSITGTADNSDYTGATTGTGKTITFAAGSATATLTIDPIADTTIEANETVILTLASGTGYTIGTTTAVTGTITNDDVALPTVTLAVSPASVLENGTQNLVYTFTRTGVTTSALTVNYGITGTATNTDYTGATTGTGKTITFAAGSNTATLTIDPTADNTIESDETVILTLATGTGYIVGTTTPVTGTIANDDSSLITTDLTSITPTQLVNTLLGSGGTASNITFKGANVAGGLFSGGIAAGIGIDSGIMLSSGNISFAKGPNNSTGKSASNGSIGDTDLNAIVTPDITNDAAVLEFDFIPTASTVSFSYVFASEEYPEYVNQFNDVFAFFVNGKNIALIPGTTTPVSIDNVNGGVNSPFFVPNYGTTFDTQFDGFTTVLSASVTGLVTGVAARFKLAIADTRDFVLDSAVFIQAASLGNSTLVTVTATDSDAGEGATPNLGVFTINRTGSTTAPLTVNYIISGTASNADYSTIPSTVTIPAGQASTTVTITPIDDLLVEGNETVILSLTDTSTYDLGVQNSATVIITDNEVQSAVVTLAVSPVSVAENGTTNLLYTFTRTGSTTSPLTVNYSVGGAASFGIDYTQTGATSFSETTGTITFATGSSTATLTIDPTADTLLEGNETVDLILASGTGYTIGTATTVTGTILDDDAPVVTVAVSPTSVLEDGTTNLVYTFTRTGSNTSALTVNYAVSGTATFNTDYVQTGAATFTSTTGSITFAAGASTATLSIDPTTDTTIEPDETIAITLSPNASYAIGTTGTVTGAIINDDISVAVSVSPTNVLEGSTNGKFTITLNVPAPTGGLVVNYNATGSTATSTTDYNFTAGTNITALTANSFTIAAGQTTATLNVASLTDTVNDPNETIKLNLISGTGYALLNNTISISNNSATLTITDVALSIPSISLTVNPTTVLEDGLTNLVYTFTRAGVTTNALTVNYGITGTAANTDFTGATTGTGKTITFAAGSATATLTIDPTADTILESNETVALTLATGTGYTIGTTTAVTGTITNDDPLPTINLSASQTIVEGLTSPQNVTYTVTLSNASSQAITVNYTSANGTATAGSDYTSTSGTLTFNAGITSQVINIPILNDSINEANETFTLTLSSPTNANLGATTTVTTTITDTLSTSVTTTLPTNVENLNLTGTTAINGTGNAGNNVLTGNSANNILTGLNGNDTYAFVANSLLGIDTIAETTTGGIDTIDFSGTTIAANLNLGVTTSQTVNSNLKLILSANNVFENAIGGNGSDRLTGNSLNNTLNGGSGNDQLQGLGGNDMLWGGLGDDILTGGAGNDQYLFQTSGVFTNTLGVDYITQFDIGQDKINLSKATFNTITGTVGQPLTDFGVVTDDELVDASTAHIVFSQSTGSLFYNQNGNVLNASSVFEFARLGNPDILLSSSDFIVS